ncbi:Radical SAM superfamily protein [Pirellulimonas nuda]|uniref:Radical SAM superfamily protein n=1 Tax=Pirellulimonas nuda TaxID=2528009 RepID=A0A518DJQ2_9BACT|nr:PA0069 family radical SAM protein [Pirellulimonas nuda]QDU91704.1 Radical SAM superfamily protein [Pirellulimonas nuda]
MTQRDAPNANAPADGARPPARGRGAQGQPDNPYLPLRVEPWLEDLEDEACAAPRTTYYDDLSQSIVSENNSPDIPFRYSVNPYRGCQHGCSYCYARPTHEYLGLSAGLDFETKVFVKRDAARLFRAWLARPKYVPEEVAMSGVTDCYQPVERQLRITRSVLEVAAACRQPIGIVTKNALVTRDLDLLSDLARDNAAGVAVSITTLDPKLARVMEPRTSTPAARLRAIRELTAGGVPVRVMAAPVIPGLNDSELPAILRAAAEAGATSAGYVLLRLPTTVREVFLEWLRAFEPTRYERVVSLVQSTRGGKLNSSDFADRQRGRGAYAQQIGQTFAVFAKKCGLSAKGRPLSAAAFRPPVVPGAQQRLF